MHQKRTAKNEGGWRKPIRPLSGTRTERLARLRARGVFLCPVCRTEIIGCSPDPRNPWCSRRCELAAQKRSLLVLPKSGALISSRCPPESLTFDPCRLGSWPSDPRPRFQGYRLDEWNGADPRSVAITGPVGAGKTTVSVELLYRLHKRGHFGGYYTTPSDLWAEDRQTPLGGERPQLERARSAPALIVDEVARGAPRDDELSILHQLADERWRRRLPTVWVTHRPLKGAGSIEELVPAVWDRWRDGLVVSLDRASQRGQGAPCAPEEKPSTRRSPC